MVITALWRIGMVGWILWACGAFASIGFPGFLSAADGKQLKEDVAGLKQSADISARISLAQEIRLYVGARCKAEDREQYDRIIERLQLDYERIAGARYAEPRCS